MRRPIICMLLLALLALPASACTGIYIGPGASTDGTIILGKSNDHQSVWPNYVCVVDHVDNAPGRSMPVNSDRTVFAPIPATTYKYTATPWMDSALAVNSLAHDATVCANECGVSMLMSVTAFANRAALQADPLIADGLTETTAVDLVTCQSATARQAVEVLAGILDIYGSSECNIALISDQKEAWYVEMYTGHQYAAVKLPADAVCVFGNEYTLEYLGDYADRIVSPGLEMLAVMSGFAKYGRNDELNLFETYSGLENRTDYSHMRTWIGHRLLAPSQYGGDYDRTANYPLCFTPDQKVSVKDVMALIRNRFEGTPYNPDETGRADMRVIGTDTALSVHITQTWPALPAEMACVTWECTAPAVYGVFVPVSNASTRIGHAYGLNQPASEAGNFDTAHYPWYVGKALNTLCVEKGARATYGTPVRQYWEGAEANMIEAIAGIMASGEDLSAEALTDYCCRVQEQAFRDAQSLLNQLLWTMANNSNTMKNSRNPETGEILDELKPVPPMAVTLDNSVYAK